MLPDFFRNPQLLWLLLLVPLVFWLASEPAKDRRRCCASPPTQGSRAKARGCAHAPAVAAPAAADGRGRRAVLALARPQVRDARVARPLGRGHRHRRSPSTCRPRWRRRTFGPHNRLHVAQGGAHRVPHRPGQRPHRAGGVRRRRLHAGPADARLRRAQGGGQAAAHARARGRHGDRRRDGDLAQPAARLGRQEPRGGAHHRRRQQRRADLSARRRARWRKTLNIPVYTILVGKGGKVPFPAGTGPVRQHRVARDRDPHQPRAAQGHLAETGGEYYRATDREALREGCRRSSTAWSAAS